MLIRIIDKKTAGHHCQTVFTLFLIIKQLQTASFIYSFSCMQFERIMSFFFYIAKIRIIIIYRVSKNKNEMSRSQIVRF